MYVCMYVFVLKPTFFFYKIYIQSPVDDDKSKKYFSMFDIEGRASEMSSFIHFFTTSFTTIFLVLYFYIFLEIKNNNFVFFIDCLNEKKLQQ